MRLTCCRSGRSSYWLSAVIVILSNCKSEARAIWARDDVQAEDYSVKYGNDTSFYDYPSESPLCSRAPSSCTPRRHWNNHFDGTQIEWQHLEDDEVHILYMDAVTAGTKLKQDMDTALRSSTSRIDVSSEDSNFRNFYYQSDKGVVPINSGDIQGDADGALTQAEIVGADRQLVNTDRGFSSVEYIARQSFVNKETGQQLPTLEIYGSPDAGILISAYSFAAHDLNSGNNKAYSSTITWNAWKAIAGDAAPNLVAQVRSEISNIETKNVMDIAHKYFPDNVIPPPPESKADPIFGGHGVWKPNDQAFLALLSTPNIKTTVNMLIDRHLILKNPVLTEIHTFPAYVIAPTHAGELVHGRGANIVLKYGPNPTGAASSSTTDTNSGGVETA